MVERWKPTKEWRKVYYLNRINKYTEYLGGKCVRCGATQKLEFDHIVPKTRKFAITSRYDARWEIVKAELDKCQLLCRQCHLEKGRELGEIQQAATHGSLGMLRYNCKCPLCRKKKSEYNKEWKRKRKLKMGAEDATQATG